MNVFELDRTYVANTYSRFPINIVNGDGSLVWDDSGKEYIDLGTGIGVNIFGYSDKEWLVAVTDQLSRFQHTSNLYYSRPCAELAGLLCSRTGLKKAFFSNSGAEANETAIKAARKYAADRKGGDCYTILTLKNSFHGRTLTTLAATGQEVFHSYFQPLTPGFVHIEPTVSELRSALCENKVAAVMVEIIRGEGGVLPLPEDFVKELYRLSREQDFILIADEVQTGNGRTGSLYGYMNYGIQPDIVTTAKGIGGGLPIGVTLLGERVEDVFTPGLNGSTFGGNPVSCAGATNIVSRIDDSLLAGVRKKSEYIFSRLNELPSVKSVCGMGLMIGIESELDAKQAALSCLERGVLVLTAKNKIRLLPALNIPDGQLERAVDTLISVLKG